MRSEQKKSGIGEMSDEWLHVWKIPAVFQLKVTVLSGAVWSLCKHISLLFQVSYFVSYSLSWLVEGKQMLGVIFCGENNGKKDFLGRAFLNVHRKF